MPMAVTYATLDGELLSEKRGGTRKDYLPNSVGSTVALLDSSQVKTDSRSYWPYGEIRTRIGSTPSAFQFVGTYGYFEDSSSRIYVRARYYRSTMGDWQTRDLFWPEEHAYQYASGNPVSQNDPTGLQVVPRCSSPKPKPSGSVTCKSGWNQFIFCFCNRCYRGLEGSSCFQQCDKMAHEYYDACKKNPPVYSPVPRPGTVVSPPFFFPQDPGRVIAPGTSCIIDMFPPYQPPTPKDCENLGDRGSQAPYDLMECIKCAKATGASTDGCYRAAYLRRFRIIGEM